MEPDDHAPAANEADADGDPLAFRIEALTSGIVNPAPVPIHLLRIDHAETVVFAG